MCLTSPIFSSIFFCLAASFLSVFIAVFSAPLPFFLFLSFLPIVNNKSTAVVIQNMSTFYSKRAVSLLFGIFVFPAGSQCTVCKQYELTALLVCSVTSLIEMITYVS